MVLNIINNLFWTTFSGFLGAIIAILFQNYSQANLDIIATDDANEIHTYPPGYVIPGTWKYFRVKVKNKKVSKGLDWLIHRQPAQQVNATISIMALGKTMKGRWSGTLELPQTDRSSWTRLANFPDPVTINAGKDEILDVFAKFENDSEAYGWNNEAYFHNWRTPQYRLDPGDYRLVIEVPTENSSYATRLFMAHIDATITDTYLKNDSKVRKV